MVAALVRLSAVVAVVALSAGCRPTSARDAVPTSPTTAVDVLATPHDRAGAAAIAEAVLSSVVLPTGARRVAAAPDAWLAHGDSGSVTITQVEERRWYEVPATAAALAESLSAHPPSRLSCPAGGLASPIPAGDGRQYRTVCLRRQEVSPWLELQAVRAGTRLAVLVDVVVVWTPAKTSDDTVPAGLASARLAFSSDVQGVPNRAVTLSGRRLAELVKAIDGETVAPPQSSADSCPPGQGEATLTVSPRVAFEVDVYGCRGVTVLVDGKAETTFGYDEEPGELVHQLLGLPPYEPP